MRSRFGLVVAVVIALAGCAWARPRFDAGNTGANPVESTIAGGNVASLVPEFVAGSSTPDVIPSLVVARGHLYVGGSVVRVYDVTGTAGCNGSPSVCEPQWSLDGGGDPDVIGTTLYRGGNAYDADGNDSCSGVPKVCTQVWQEGIGTATPGTTDPMALHLEGHRSLSGHGGSEVASIYGYDTACTPTDCGLQWVGPLGTGGGGGTIAGPAVGGSRVFASYSPVGAPNGTLHAFDGTVGQVGPELWSALLPGVGEPYVATADGVVVTAVWTAAGSILAAYDAAGVANCAGAPVVCQPLWQSDLWQGTGSDRAPAIANGVVYRSSGGRLAAYDLHGSGACTGTPLTCSPRWDGSSGAELTAPAVANGLVFVGDAAGRVLAFDARGQTDCSATIRQCAPLWSADVGAAAGGPEVAGGRVYVPAGDGAVHVFGLPS